MHAHAQVAISSLTLRRENHISMKTGNAQPHARVPTAITAWGPLPIDTTRTLAGADTPKGRIGGKLRGDQQASIGHDRAQLLAFLHHRAHAQDGGFAHAPVHGQHRNAGRPR